MEKKQCGSGKSEKSAWASLDKKLTPSTADLPIQRIINHMNSVSQITKYVLLSKYLSEKNWGYYSVERKYRTFKSTNIYTELYLVRVGAVFQMCILVTNTQHKNDIHLLIKCLVRVYGLMWRFLFRKTSIFFFMWVFQCWRTARLFLTDLFS